MSCHKGILVGMKTIADYTALSEDVIIYLINEASFPAKKTRGPTGTWISNTDSIDEWSRLFAQSNLDI